MAACCTLAVMTLPVIITALARPGCRTHSSARPAGTWAPRAGNHPHDRPANSISGILTGVILQVSRAAGETAPILFTGAVFFVPVADQGLASWFPYGRATAHGPLDALVHPGDQVRGVGDDVQYGTAVVLIGLVLAVNALSIGCEVLEVEEEW